MTIKDLDTPFTAKDIEWRIQRSGVKNNKPWAMVLAYVTNRAIMDRLDSVCEKQNWKNVFVPGANTGVMCGISIKIGDEWITKYDGADNTNIESVKGGLSSAMKRAAVQWGIGRYLYHLEAGWADIREDGVYRGEAKKDNNKVYFNWNPPPLPAWALPKGEKPIVSVKPKDEPDPPKPPKPPDTADIKESIVTFIDDNKDKLDEDTIEKADLYIADDHPRKKFEALLSRLKEKAVAKKLFIETNGPGLPDKELF